MLSTRTRAAGPRPLTPRLAVKVRRGCRDSPEPPVECGGAQDRSPRGRGDAGGRPRSLPASSRATGARWPVLDFNQQPFLSGTTNSHSTHCHAGYEPTAVRERPMPVRNSSTDHRHRRRHRRRRRRRRVDPAASCQPIVSLAWPPQSAGTSSRHRAQGKSRNPARAHGPWR